MLKSKLTSKLFVIIVALLLCSCKCTKNKITKGNEKSQSDKGTNVFQNEHVASNHKRGNLVINSAPENSKITENIEEIVQKSPTRKGHILFFLQLGTKSHIFFMKSLVEGLLQNGHEVTTIFYVKTNIVHENYTEVLIKDRSDEIFTKFSKVALEYGGSTLSPGYIYRAYNIFTRDTPRMCYESIIESEMIMKRVKEKTKVDAVITMNTCGAYVSHLLDTPLILISAVAPIPILLEGLGNSVNLFAQPHPILPSVEPLSFLGRIKNIFIGNLWNALIYHIASVENNNLQDILGYSLPNIGTILKERSAFKISNSHFVTHGSWPYYKNLVEVGGIHLKPAVPLPLHLQEYMDAHPEGVVYVSFGSTFKPSEMKKEQKTILLNTFRKSKFPIIWKWNDDDLSGIPGNVRVEKWVPQNDLLAHPNLKVFVTHGGLLSIQEALYHKIPLVGLPLAQDQISNIERAEKNGFAIKVSLQTLSEQVLISAVGKAMVDQGIRDSVKRMHNLFTEEIGGTPMQKGVKAVEYVIKHKYCDHLKPKTLEMRPYESYGYDIFIVLIILIGSVSFISFKIFTWCLTKCCYKKSKQD